MPRPHTLPSWLSRGSGAVVVLLFCWAWGCGCVHPRVGSWDQDRADGVPNRTRPRTYATDAPLRGAPRAAGPQAAPLSTREPAEIRDLKRPASGAALEPPAGESKAAQPLSWPVSRVVVTSPFGPRRDPLNPDQDRSRWHAGVDLRGQRGTAVLAAGAGRVVRAGWRGNHGHSVCIDHGHGLRTTYSHLAKLFVYEGDDLDAGSLVGLLGESGRTTGPHLHFEVRRWGRPIDPVRLLGPEPGDGEPVPEGEGEGETSWGFGGRGR